MRAHDPLRPGRAWLRFLVAGGANTGATLLLYWMLLTVLSAQPAYAISYAAGIVLSYVLNTRFVFRARHTWIRFAAFPLVYVAGYLAGAVVLGVALHWIGPLLAPLAAVLVTVPLTFVLSRWLLSEPTHAGSDDSP